MNRRSIARTSLLGAAMLVAAATAFTVGRASPANAGGVIDAGHFVRYITNPYLPYRPGSRWVSAGVKDGVTQRDVVTVRRRTKTILGVTATVITDVATHRGTVLERTTDWYAQDDHGNVWYSGGGVDTSGSWQAGVDGARPGIVMTAHPQVGDTHHQEFLAGQAEDQYWLVDLNQHVTVPFGAFRHAALTLEWSRLEPNVIDRKLYVRGIGVVSERSAQGPPEVAELVSFSHP